MAYSSPAAIVTGTTISKTTFGDVVKADLDFLANPPACRVYNSAATTSIPNNAATTLTFDSERFDTDSMHSTVTNTSRITVNTAGLYVVNAQVFFAGNGTGERYVAINVNGATTIVRVQQVTNTTTGPWRAQAITLWKAAATNYFEVSVFQNSGAALNIQGGSAGDGIEFMAHWVGLG